MNEPVNNLTKIYANHVVPNIVADVDTVSDRVKQIHNQHTRILSITVQVLDKNDSVLDTITGKCTEGSVKIDTSSLIRRGASLTMVVDPKMTPGPNSILWFNNRLRVYVGIKDLSHNPQEFVNFLMGTFYVDDGDIHYSASSSELTIGLSDKMMQYNERKLDSKLEIAAGTPISVAIKKMMELLGETEFGYIEDSEPDEVVPYKYEKTPGEKITDVITDMRDMYMDHYCYYNKMGQFEYRKVKSQLADEVNVPMWTFDESKEDKHDLSISFQEKYDLNKIRNKITVFGNTDSAGSTPSQLVTLTDAASPFNVDAIGERSDIIVDTTLSTMLQCLSRAQYELWKQSNFQETCTLESVPLYFLDGGDTLEIVHPETKVHSKYIIDSIEYNLAVTGTMSITAHKLYFTSLAVGEQVKPLVDAIINGIKNYGWISLGEQRIKDCYNISGDGKAELIVRFVNEKLGGTQAMDTGYTSTTTQVMEIDLADYQNLITGNDSGDAGRSSGDYLDRVLSHEMFHAVFNNYLGVAQTMYIPKWFNEGMGELLIGGRERYQSLTGYASAAIKKTNLINRCKELLNNDWYGDSTDYTCSYLLAAAVYQTLSAEEWNKLFQHLRETPNLTVNFVNALVPSAASNEDAKSKLIATLTNSTIWARLEDKSDIDVLSIGGDYFMNLYNKKLDAQNVFNGADASVDSIGFVLKIMK